MSRRPRASASFAGLAPLVGLLVALVLVGASPATGSAAEQEAPQQGSIRIGEGERLLVIAPHPDDETLGAGGLIQEVLSHGGQAHIVWVTAGDGYVEAVEHETGELRPRAAEFVAYGERRIGEAHAAARVLGGDGGEGRLHTHVLGFPDGGLAALLRDHWARSHPERSPTTGVLKPPYPESEHAGAKYDGADLRRELVDLVVDVGPSIIALPDPADRHPDHHATGLFALLAIDDWADAEHRYAKGFPRLLAYLVHWPGWPPGWDQSVDRQSVGVPLVLPAGLPSRGLARGSLSLTEAELDRKLRALGEHATQRKVMPELLYAFLRTTEPFTVFSAEVLEHLTDSVERELAEHERAARHDAPPGNAAKSKPKD